MSELLSRIGRVMEMGPTRPPTRREDDGVRMNEYGNINAQVNAEKCTGNDRVQDRMRSRFTGFSALFRERERKEDGC